MKPMSAHHPATPNLPLLEAISASYAKHAGSELGEGNFPEDVAKADRKSQLAWLDASAPFGILAHNTDDDPKFIYANRAALKMFGDTLDEFLGMPSRLSAAPERQPARAAFLERVSAQGIVHDYADIRVDRSGRSFRIREGSLWQVAAPDGSPIGQAALIWFGGRVD